jgi:hypothetical protein
MQTVFPKKQEKPLKKTALQQIKPADKLKDFKKAITATNHPGNKVFFLEQD